MQALHACCCGLDVHKRFVVACLIRAGENGKHHKELRRFDTLTPDLLRLIELVARSFLYACGPRINRCVLEAHL